MAIGRKTGGRVAGSRNKPKPATDSGAVVAEPASPPPPPAAPPEGFSPSRTPARARAASKPGQNLTVEMWPLARLKPYEHNPRKNDHAIDRMCASIRRFGFPIPIVARADGLIVDGHLRYKAALRLKLPEVPVAVADKMTEAQTKAFRLVANRSATWADWDVTALGQELTDLRASGFSLADTGFEPDELARLLGDDDLLVDGDEAEPVAFRAKKPKAGQPAVCPKCLHSFVVT